MTASSSFVSREPKLARIFSICFVIRSADSSDSVIADRAASSRYNSAYKLYDITHDIRELHMSISYHSLAYSLEVHKLVN